MRVATAVLVRAVIGEYASRAEIQTNALIAEYQGCAESGPVAPEGERERGPPDRVRHGINRLTALTDLFAHISRPPERPTASGTAAA